MIGAGYAGNGVAKALTDAGIAYDQLERTDHVGGNWADGVYDSTHIISSRDTTQYGDFPMPRDYPDFPSREQVIAYLNDYVDCFGLRAPDRVRPGGGRRPAARLERARWLAGRARLGRGPPLRRA